MKVVLYAEGRGEIAGAAGERPLTRARLPDSNLGAGHLLVKRCLEQAGVPEVCFENPLLHKGREARGSDLLRAKTVRKLLAYPNSPPDLAVILVDADEKAADRRRSLLDAVSGRDSHLPRAVVAVAVQEFEAWLIAAHTTAQEVLETVLDTPPSPEKMARGEAKECLQAWLQNSERDHLELRRSIVAVCDLSEIARRCPSFRRLERELSAEAIALLGARV